MMARSGTAPIREPTPDALRAAGELIRAGGLVAFPTETVYGLGADATNDTAVARIFAAKRRPSFNPLIVHVADAASLDSLVVFDGRARQLADRFWPGPLSLVLPRNADCAVSRLASAGLDTLAVRRPAHDLARRFLSEAGSPVAAPSANLSGALSPTTAAHVAEGLGDAVDLILDGGPCPVGLESTVVDLSTSEATLLRPGAVTAAEIEAVIGTLRTDTGEGPVKSPGQLESHYAPRLPLRLAATTVAPDEALLAFGAHVPPGAGETRNLSASGDLLEAAANLFAMLHALDQPKFSAIAVMPVPDGGIGAAINDRLRRAAAPRDALSDRP